jgi:long-subunit acyl-CoA synthetase (AMP-forming)
MKRTLGEGTKESVFDELYARRERGYKIVETVKRLMRAKLLNKYEEVTYEELNERVSKIALTFSQKFGSLTPFLLMA